MNIVREYINEKFTEDTDPVRDIGIGIYYFDVQYYTVFGLEEGIKKEVKPYKLKCEILNTDHKYTTIRCIGKRNNLVKFIKTIYSYNPSTANNLISKLKPISESLLEKFKEESDPIHDMDIGIKEAIKYKLGLEYGKDLPEIFKGKSFYAFKQYDRLQPDTGIGGAYENQYQFMEFYDIEKINDQWFIQTCWSVSKLPTDKILSYPVDQFEKELNS